MILPGQLVTTDAMSCQTDQLFSGLGLSSYVAKKDSGSIATKMLAANGSSFGTPSGPPAKLPPPLSGPPSFSLEQKQKWMKDSENLQRLTANEPLAPSHAMARTNSTAAVKDLTDSLMASNINKMSSSQTYSGGFLPQPTGGFRPPVQGGFQNFGSGPLASVMPQTAKPDLSGFDSLLPMAKPKQTLNAIKSVQPAPNYLLSGANLLAPSPSGNFLPTSSGPNPLSASEINDLLS
jgi:hypothetical protein